MSEGEKIAVNMVVVGAERIAALDELKRRDHSSRSGVLNKALDLLIEREGMLEDLCAGEVAHA